MLVTFKIGDHVTWNSEAGHVSGKIIEVHVRDFQYKGYTHHASEDDPVKAHRRPGPTARDRRAGPSTDPVRAAPRPR